MSQPVSRRPAPVRIGFIRNNRRVSDSEIALPGGKLNRVVRVGNTVHRSAGPWTPTVHALLRHVRSNGFRFAPEPFGYDDEGREVLEYVSGDTIGDAYPWPSWVWSETLLEQVGRAAADYHSAVADFHPPEPAAWQYPPVDNSPLICHHDLAPYNVVTDDGELGAIIDWDLAGPGSVQSELAFIAWQWVPLWRPESTRSLGWDEPPDIGRRLRLLLDSYGLEERSGFIDHVISRVVQHYESIVVRAAEGIPAYVKIVQEGHVENMMSTAVYLQSVRSDLQAMIT
jgi:hypothetical protein